MAVVYRNTAQDRTNAVASAIPGVSLDCDLASGARAGGGTATDNAAAINAALAAATATAPVRVTLDGPTLMGDSLVIPATGNVTVEGIGWSSGIFTKSGTNRQPVRTSNYGTTNAEMFVAFGASGPSAITGGNVRLANFYLNMNRGTYPNGLVSAALNDGTNGAGAVDARGIPTMFFVTGICLAGLENLVIENVRIYDSPCYAIDLYHCKKVHIRGLRIEAADPTFTGNTDGIHVNGGCSDVLIEDCYLSTGDDPIAFNLAEGNGQPGANFTAQNITLAGSLTGGRVYGSSTATHRVTFRGYRGSVQWLGLLVGVGAASASEGNHSVYVDDWEVDVTSPVQGGGLVYLIGSCGLVEVTRVRAVEPTAAHPIVQQGGGGAAFTVSSLRCGGIEVHRNASGNAAVNLLSGMDGTISELSIDGFRVTDVGSYAAIPYLINLSGSAAITRIRVNSVDMNHITAFCNDYSKVGAGGISGPGIAGIALPDSAVADGWPYLSSNNSNLPAIKVGGVRKSFNLT